MTIVGPLAIHTTNPYDAFELCNQIVWQRELVMILGVVLNN